MNPISVLLVDDNRRFLQVATRFLQSHCAEDIVVVGTAEGGEEGLDQARRLQPRVVLLDLCMPGMSGLDAIPLLREALPKTCIIALTLFDTDSYRQAAMKAGADGFVPKAVLDSDLLPAIRRAVEADSIE